VVTWRYLRHPNIVPFLGLCDKSPLCLVSRWMEEGTLIDFFRRYPSERRTSYVSAKILRMRASRLTVGQLLGTFRGLAFMHSLGVVHGDLKAVPLSFFGRGCDIDPSQINVLVDRQRPARLADFGLVSVLNSATTALTNVSGGSGTSTIRSVSRSDSLPNTEYLPTPGTWLQSCISMRAAP
jgi:serine/threonine protein kinase